MTNSNTLAHALTAARRDTGDTEAELLAWLFRPTTYWNAEGSRPAEHVDDAENVLAAYYASKEIPW